MIVVEVNQAQMRRVKELLRNFPPALRAKAIPRAVQKTARWGRTRITRATVRVLALTQREVRRSVLLPRGRDRMAGKIVVTGRRIPLIKFSARQTRVGVSYRISRGGRKVIPGAFIPGGRSAANVVRTAIELGRAQVYRRRGKPRFPLYLLRGPSIPEVVRNEVLQESLRDLGSRLEMEVDRQVRVILERGR